MNKECHELLQVLLDEKRWGEVKMVYHQQGVKETSIFKQTEQQMQPDNQVKVRYEG